MSLPLQQWSCAIGTLGETVAGLNDIEQQITIILRSPPGCDPLRPEFACDLIGLIDRPVNLVRGEAIRRITDALNRWMDGQITVVSVTLAAVDDLATWAEVEINYTVAGDLGVLWTLRLPVARASYAQIGGL
jgi:phage baseplate assembly protein W